MLFEGNTNNSNNEKTVSTRGGIDFRNENGFDPCMLSVDLWKSCVSLKLNPALPPEKQTEYKKFDFDTTMYTALTPQNAYILLKNIEEVIYPAIKNNEKKFVGVPVNGNGLIGVGSGRTDGSEPYIGVFKGLDPDTKKPENGMCYQFKENVVIEDYDFETGKYEAVSIPAITELQLFVLILKEGIKAATNAQTHSYRNVQNYYNTTMMDLIKRLADKNGIASSMGSSGGYSRSNVFGNKSDGMDDIPDSSVEKISEEVDNINSFLN